MSELDRLLSKSAGKPQVFRLTERLLDGKNQKVRVKPSTKKNQRNPHRITYSERVCFQMSKDKPLKEVVITRAKRNSALQINQQKLIGFRSTHRPQVKRAAEYHQDQKTVICSVE